MDVAGQINSVVNNISSKLGDIAKQLGVAVNMVYPMFVQKAFTDGIVGLIFAIISVIVILFTLTYAYKVFYKSNKDGLSKYEIAVHSNNYSSDEHEAKYAIMIIVLGIISFIFGVYLLVSLGDTINHLVNPQYCALKELTDLVKNTTSK